MGSTVFTYETVVAIDNYSCSNLIVTLGRCDIGPGYILYVVESSKPEYELTAKELSVIIGEKIFSSKENVYDNIMRLIVYRRLLLKYIDGYCTSDPNFESPNGYCVAGDWLL